MSVGPEQFERLVETLNRHQVEYLLIGGIAVLLHGTRRPTVDLDLVAGHDDLNLDRLAAALNDLNAQYRGRPVKAANLRGGNSRWATDAGQVDVLWEASSPDGPVSYGDLADRGVNMRYGSLSIPVVSVRDLAALKRAAGRPKDIDTILELHRLYPDEVPPPDDAP